MLRRQHGRDHGIRLDRDLPLFAGGDPTRLFLVPQRMFAQVSGITLMSIPFFLLMGNLMTVGGVSKSLFGFRTRLPRPPLGRTLQRCHRRLRRHGRHERLGGRLRGGYRHDRHQRNDEVGLRAPVQLRDDRGGRRLGPIIPPSITLILYAGLTQTSVNSLFAAGAVPGPPARHHVHGLVLLGLPRRNYAKTEPAPWRERLQAFREAFFALMTPSS